MSRGHDARASARSPQVPARIAWVVDQLELRPGQRVLEIGCGPGYALALALAKLERGTLTGIDRSPLQVARASAHNRLAIAEGRARVDCLALGDAPEVYGPRAFDTLFAINVNAFWTEPEPSIAALLRLARPRARAYLAYEPPSSAKLREMQRSLPPLLGTHGLRIEAVRVAELGPGHGLCVVAGRATATSARR